MRKINIHEAKTTLSRLVEAVEAGEEIVLARAGRPVAMITRLPVRHGIRIGTAKGLVQAILLLFSLNFFTSFSFLSLSPSSFNKTKQNSTKNKNKSRTTKPKEKQSAFYFVF